MKNKSLPTKKVSLDVKGTTIATVSQKGDDYICVTDVARYKDSERTDYIIQNWLRNRNTIEFLGIWEQLNNPDFNPIEFDGIRKQAGLNSFILTAKRWIESTGAIGLISRPGRYGGTYAHKDIAFEFASWVSVEFKLYLIKEFQRLKDDENDAFPLRGISTARFPRAAQARIGRATSQLRIMYIMANRPRRWRRLRHSFRPKRSNHIHEPVSDRGRGTPYESSSHCHESNNHRRLSVR